MKRIGIVGGIGPESTMYYYHTIIDLCRKNEDLHGNFPEIIIYNLNFIEIMELAKSDEEKYIDKIAMALHALYQAGADFGIIACNTIHIHFESILKKSRLPLLSIVEETYKEVALYKLERVGLMGTAKTMNSSYYQDVFEKYGISIVVPQENEKAYIDEKIMTELVSGTIVDTTRDKILDIARRMIRRDSVQGLVLGCTELPLLITRESGKVLAIPVFDTAALHARSALRYAISF